MIDFPNSPTVGQNFSAAGVTWQWDGAKWTATGLNNAYVKLAGDTMTGPLTLPGNPVGNLQAVPKQYVDAFPIIGDNRLINGDMRIDQRNNGASGTAVNVYTVDRWKYGATQTAKFNWQRTSAGPPGFPYDLAFVSQSAYAALATDAFYSFQTIEADMISDFAWGGASAQPVTLSFWAYSSLTGPFGGSIENAAGTRSYPFTYLIPTANTWTKIVVTIPGDTGGTWVISGNAAGVILNFDLGSGANYRGPANAWASANYVGANGAVSVVGTNGATFALTGVKLEIGSVATPFNRQSLAKSMADCQRYYQTYAQPLIGGYAAAAGTVYGSSMLLPVLMRAAPTVGLGTPSYSNASGLVLGANLADSVRLNMTITATGQGWAVANPLTLSAEL